MTEETLFELARNTPEAERAALLDRACAGQPELRARVEALLQADADSSPLSKPSPTIDAITGFQATASYTSLEAPGTIIASKYKLLQQIGEGGMGSVWMADQTEPVKRRVAVKLIRTDRGSSKTILARFEAERQTIALMDHPHIAKLLDAGATENSSPYFVMELVKGVPLTEFCDAQTLSIPERLRLFMQICSAVQHAHQKGIIHRDLKPSNILVELHDDKPVPKVIDFGLAKATSGIQLTENTLFTGFGTIAGTPLYMAPEQANFNAVDIDTRADIYALGIILYELLTGSTPISRETLKLAALDEMMKLIREQEAPTPSSRLCAVEAEPSTAANRQMEPLKLSRYIQGDLDWIVMKALSKERERRYETANGFARDIERFLHDEPTTAGPPSLGYKLRKFVQRNRGKVLAASLVILAVLAGLIGTSLGLLEARRQEAEAKRQEGLAREEAVEKEKQRDIAMANEKQAKVEKENAERAAAAEKTARQDEERERKFAQAIASFMKDDFLALTSVEGQGRFGGEGLDRHATLLELLNRAAGKLKDRKDLDPRIEAELCWIVGVNYRGAGQAVKGIPFLERTVELRKQVLGVDHVETLNAQNSLAAGYRRAGQTRKALPLIEETVRLMKAKLGSSHPSTLNSMGILAGCYDDAGQFHKAWPLIKETLKLKKGIFGDQHPSTLDSMGQLAKSYQDAGQLEKALPLFEETLRLKRLVHGDDHLRTLESMTDLAVAYRNGGQLDKALPLMEETLKLKRMKLGDNHPETYRSMGYLAGVYQATGHIDKALPLMEETLKRKRDKLGDEHPETLNAMNNLALGYRSAEKHDKALPLFEKSLKGFQDKVGKDHTHTITIMGNLALCYEDCGQLDKALPMLEETLKLNKAKKGNNHPETLLSMYNLAVANARAGQIVRALPMMEESLKLIRAKLGDEHPLTLSNMHNLAHCYMNTKQLDKALPLFEVTLKLRKTKLGADHPDTLVTMNSLGEAYDAADQLEKALPLFEVALKFSRTKLGDNHPKTLIIMNNLAKIYGDTGQLSKAVSLFEDILRHRKMQQGPDHPDTLISMTNLARGYQEGKQFDKALPLFEEAAQEIAKLRNQHEKARFIIPKTIVAYLAAKEFDKAESWQKRWLAHLRTEVGNDSSAYANELAEYGLSLFQRKKSWEAEVTLRECLTIREKKEPDAWTTFNTQFLLGEALLRQKKYPEAEPLLLKGYEGMKSREKTIPPQGSTRLPEALDSLIQLYTETNLPDEVRKWQAERQKYPQQPGSYQ